jgi:hypothetical protein
MSEKVCIVGLGYIGLTIAPGNTVIIDLPPRPLPCLSQRRPNSSSWRSERFGRRISHRPGVLANLHTTLTAMARTESYFAHLGDAAVQSSSWLMASRPC